MLSLQPVSPALGTEVTGINLGNDVSAADFDRIYRAWIDTGLLVIRDQDITPAELTRFTRRFGEIVVYTRSENAHHELPEVLVLSNIVRDGRPIGSPASGRYWHSDGHFLEMPPSASLLYAVEIPPVGGETWFANMMDAYDDLEPALKERLDGLRVVISRVRSRPYNYPDRPPPTEEQKAAWPDMPQPLVRTHPVNGRKALYVGGNVPWLIEGMEEAESTPLVRALQQHSIQSKYVYFHEWRQGDLVVWDNRSLIHKATGYDAVNHRRHMLRTAVAGDRPF
jgi:taurine dioxygenase/putative 2-oxoglutarate oxygenase